jgi:hypothetical protein
MSVTAVTTSNAFAPSALSADRAARAIMRERGDKGGIVVDRFRPDGWLEMDVCEVSAAGFMSEFEIKLSRADFAADRDKVIIRDEVAHTKHGLLARHDVRGPCRFWFIVPLGLVEVEQLPPWAGLIELVNRGPSAPLSDRWRPLVRTPAPALHHCRVEVAIETAALRAAHGRFHRMLEG